MAKRPLISPEEILKLLDCDLELGHLTWRERPRSLFQCDWSFKVWNNKYPGTRALTSISQEGYCRGTIMERNYFAHRILMAARLGRWPKFVDHVNGIKTDNRALNLREVSRKQNAMNIKIPANNGSGRIGVRWLEDRKKWAAHIQVEGRSIFLGHHQSMELAVAARAAAEKKFGFHANHGRR